MGREYVLRLADDFSDGGGSFGEDGRGIDAVEANVGGDVKARHLLLLFVCLFVSLSITHSIDPQSSFRESCVRPIIFHL